MSKKTLNNVNNVLVASLAIVYVTYLIFMKKHKFLVLFSLINGALLLLTKNQVMSMVASIMVVLSLEIMLKKYEGWGVDMNIGTGKPFNVDYKTLEGFKGASKKKRRKVEHFDDDDVEESYIDLGTSFLEAYKSLTPQQIEKMSNDTRSLMSHQKQLIETLDNLGPVIKGGKKIMEQFKHYFKDEL